MEFTSYFMLDSLMNVEEDTVHEFKGHRLISCEEIPAVKKRGPIAIPGEDAPKQTRPTKQAVSRCFCAFLNSGKGGDVYLGVSDEGRVISLSLSPAQMDHVLLQTARTFANYMPSVPPDMWWVAFVPVVTSRSEVHERLEIVRKWREFKTSDIKRLKPHVFPGMGRCWCDFNHETEHVNRYIIRVHLRSAKTRFRDTLPERRMKLPTVYQAEDGNAYFRNNASTMRYSPHQIISHAQYMVDQHYKPIVDKLKEEMTSLL